MRQPLESQARNTRQKKRGERFQDHPNPLKIARLNYGYTQKEISDQLKITRQVIIDNELGLSMHPNPKIVAYLSQYDPVLRVALSEAWYAWRKQRRADMDDPEGPTILVDWLSSLVQPPESFAGVITQTTGSVRGFARMLILQTSIVNAYINSGHHWKQIELALHEATISPTLVAMLHHIPRNPELGAHVVR